MDGAAASLEPAPGRPGAGLLRVLLLQLSELFVLAELLVIAGQRGDQVAVAGLALHSDFQYSDCLLLFTAFP